MKYVYKFDMSKPHEGKAYRRNLRVSVMADSFDAAYRKIKEVEPDASIWAVVHIGRVDIIDECAE